MNIENQTEGKMWVFIIKQNTFNKLNSIVNNSSHWALEKGRDISLGNDHFR